MWSPYFPSWGFWNDLGETRLDSWAVQYREGLSWGCAPSAEVQEWNAAAAAVQGLGYSPYVTQDRAKWNGFILCLVVLFCLSSQVMWEMKWNPHSRHRWTFCLVLLSLMPSLTHAQLEKNSIFQTTPVCFGREIWSPQCNMLRSLSEKSHGLFGFQRNILHIYRSQRWSRIIFKNLLFTGYVPKASKTQSKQTAELQGQTWQCFNYCAASNGKVTARGKSTDERQLPASLFI